MYRSGQMSPGALRRTLHDYHVKTVMNLRGANPREPWYQEEIATTLAAGVTQIDLPLSSCVWMSRIQLRALVRILDHCDYPVLLHCAWGSERTGLTAAISQLLRPGSSLEDARSQLGLRYLYVRIGDGKIMAEFLDQYERWLVHEGLTHEPEVFRRWVEGGYIPGKPSREEWPYDPSPLFIVTHPTPSGLAGDAQGPSARKAGVNQTGWRVKEARTR
ncbi:MAG: tyrosine-protein phosphatase [Isosphaeraceae bacterium]